MTHFGFFMAISPIMDLSDIIDRFLDRWKNEHPVLLWQFFCYLENVQSETKKEKHSFP